MRLTAAFLITALLLSAACRTDYDIDEAAPQEHLDEENLHLTDEHEDCIDEECEHEHIECDHEHEADAAEPAFAHEESDEHDPSEIAGSDRHVHDAGQRNHGTGWFFNQPWAATFIWGKMFRDSLILLVLSAVVFLVSGYIRKRQR